MSIVGLNGEEMKKAKPTKDAEVRMAINQLAGGLQQLSQRLEIMERNPSQGQAQSKGTSFWVQYGNKLFSILPGTKVENCGKHIHLHFSDQEDVIIDPADFDKFKEWSEEFTNAAESLTEVCFGWIKDGLMSCGSGVLNLEAEVNRLELKSQTPVDPENNESHNQEEAAQAATS